MANKKINNNGYEYVDLGLPSGTLWATMNVGAKRPSDFGLYFQWGDTQGYTADQVGTDEGQKKFYWTDYKWNPSGDGETFTKYASPGLSLDLDDDAANANMGGDWHTPTPSQIKELIENTTSYWTTQDSIQGMILISNKDTSKYIFIPAAGSAYYGSVHGSRGYGLIWSSMLSADRVYGGQTINFNYGGVYLSDYGSNRNNGLSIRAVIG